MNRVRLMFSTLLVGVVVTTSSCGNDTPTAVPQPKALEPRPEPELNVISGWKALIDSCSSLPAVSVQQTIGKAGGTIVAGPDTLRIPASALSKPVTITASLPDGYFVNIVKFQPDGLRFRKAATLSMGYSNCNVLAFLNLGIAQVTDDLQIIQYLKSTDNKKTKTVTAQLQHFSNYAVAW